ncbi:nucleotidyltransferase [Methanosarcina siciliae T4/M]|uniref:protein adenylyltransferase n=2 Tax=Methanosarcina siciliae TaxID=38027 RepID=A0A0E3PDN8_9EURY|nr:nucleotidyltransferase family protein [Methanosarcina siciliae]AKB28432.1 nucleotidyltransferase [Methanosarcina siciliae T4/M]AKB32223.1 nucleotidyltransferase [Methanosarcina siciliae HI350]
MTGKTTSVPTGEQTKDTAYFTKILRQHLPALSKQYGISYLGIFGSYVRGEQKEDSDLDVLVEFSETPALSKTPDLFEFIGLKQDLSDMLGIKVDLVMKNALKPGIGERIREEVVQV